MRIVQRRRCGSNKGREVVINNDIYMSRERYLLALKRVRKAIAKGREFRATDIIAPGCKSTEVTWGMCSVADEDWPDPEDHLWPEDFIKYGRVAPKYREGHPCPYDRDPDPEHMRGCFYRCMAFDRKDKDKDDRNSTLRKYDLVIEQFEKHGDKK